MTLEATAAVRPPRFHVALSASRAHFQETVAFYEKVFGTAPSKVKPGYAKFDLAEPALNLSLNQVDEVQRGDLDHLGIQVWSDGAVDAARERMVAAGLAHDDETEVECCYAKQTKVWVTDPDGRKLEFFHVLHDVEHHGRMPMAEKSVATPAAACCAPTCCQP